MVDQTRVAYEVAITVAKGLVEDGSDSEYLRGIVELIADLFPDIAPYVEERVKKVQYAIWTAPSSRCDPSCQCTELGDLRVKPLGHVCPKHDCEGHPAGPFDPIGETVYCDGTCER